MRGKSMVRNGRTSTGSCRILISKWSRRRHVAKSGGGSLSHSNELLRRNIAWWRVASDQAGWRWRLTTQHTQRRQRSDRIDASSYLIVRTYGTCSCCQSGAWQTTGKARLIVRRRTPPSGAVRWQWRWGPWQSIGLMEIGSRARHAVRYLERRWDWAKNLHDRCRWKTNRRCCETRSSDRGCTIVRRLWLMKMMGISQRTCRTVQCRLASIGKGWCRIRRSTTESRCWFAIARSPQWKSIRSGGQIIGGWTTLITQMLLLVRLLVMMMMRSLLGKESVYNRGHGTSGFLGWQKTRRIDGIEQLTHSVIEDAFIIGAGRLCLCFCGHHARCW